MMKRITLVALMAVSAFAVKAQQTISILDNGPVTLDCGAGPAFEHSFNDDNTGGAYPPNSNFSITVCPDGIAGSKVTLRMFPEVGDVWDIHGSDTLFVYDGANASAPLLGAFTEAWYLPVLLLRFCIVSKCRTCILIYLKLPFPKSIFCVMMSDPA